MRIVHLYSTRTATEPIVTVCQRFLASVSPQRSSHRPTMACPERGYRWYSKEKSGHEQAPRATKALCTAIRLLCSRNAHRLEGPPGTWTMEGFTRLNPIQGHRRLDNLFNSSSKLLRR